MFTLPERIAATKTPPDAHATTRHAENTADPRQPAAPGNEERQGLRSVGVLSAIGSSALLGLPAFLGSSALLGSLILLLIVLAMPRTAHGHVDVTLSLDGPAGNVVSQDGSLVTSFSPVPGQGGTCIEGRIVDRYYQPRGEGWVVTATPENGPSQSADADADGAFRLDDLAGGTWVLELELPDTGWQPYTMPAFPVTLDGASVGCAPVRFQVEALPCLIVTKMDAGDSAGLEGTAGVPGWGISATYSETVHTAVTGGTGQATFQDLQPGTWTVREEDRMGWRPAEGHDYERTIDLESPREPGQCALLTFVNEQVHDACIQAQAIDPLGEPLSGWKMVIVRDDGTFPSASSETNATGIATFEGVALGDWTVEEQVQPWWRTRDRSIRLLSLDEPGRCELVVFESEPLGCIDGYKTNHLGQGLPGWTITATNDMLDEEHAATTSEDGYFRLMDLPLGTWEMFEGAREGWTATTSETLEVDVWRPFACTTVRFQSPTDLACLDTYARDSVDGAGLPGWEIHVAPKLGGETLAGLTDGTGHVRFVQLVPGNYAAAVTSPEGWQAAEAESKDVELDSSGTCPAVTFDVRQESLAPLPKAAPAKMEPERRKDCRLRYRIRRGDTLTSIARRYGTTVARLVRVNHLRNANRIYAGRRLCIP